jgi:hypothetical protein
MYGGDAGASAMKILEAITDPRFASGFIWGLTCGLLLLLLEAIFSAFS